ncbi:MULTISPECIES: C39 family peptidase [Bacillus cereus group]|uniref:C39 family peptidase n=1 Tax=Bacillus cereus group TaxID=86661 RepID=UPI000764AD40|nr:MULTISPECIES: C39 family peptidase [Bacillus cereus group]MEB8716262.1 C39 family peptidase [Bacillus cereus]MRB03039.1 peptidase C39 family protein [Bacillus thuringiensis]MEB9432934.1 C39 family peptidase [Bacillus cereus]MEB9479951.1 C39 family peptidase [Bacillus cereus]MEB9589616.1 C39 family peptidase [Bacillus cereus]
MKAIRKLKWYICIALLGAVIWSVYTNGIPKYIEKFTFSNIQRGKETEFSNNDEKVILANVPLIQQLPELDRGCEVTSLAMMLQYAGVSVDKMTLANEIKKVDFIDDGVRGNPNEGFVGNIYTFSESGYAVYHGPLFQLAEKYLPNKAVDLTGKNIEEIYKSIKAGKPVVMITNATFAPLDEAEFTTWETNSGDVSITYNEHCVVLIGYDQESVYIRDPLEDSLDVKVPRETFEQAWVQMGSQAISYVKSAK